MQQDESEDTDYNWPVRFENGLNIKGMIKQGVFRANPVILPSTLVQYLLVVCDRLKVSVACIQLTLSLLSRFLKRRPNAFPLQLALMSSLFISSKLLETNPPQLNELHKWSCNSFTSKDFYRVQKSILVEIDFNVLNQGLPDIQIKLVANCVKSLLDDDHARILLSVLEDLQKVVWSYIYSGKIKMKEGRDRALTAALIHLSLVLLTQYSGKFLQSIWACQLTHCSYKQASSLSSRILKQILGQAKCKIYKL